MQEGDCKKEECSDAILRNNIYSQIPSTNSSEELSNSSNKNGVFTDDDTMVCLCEFMYRCFNITEIDDFVKELCKEYITSTDSNPGIDVPSISQTSVIILTILYAIVFSLAILGNICVILVIIFNKSFRGSATSLIFSLTIADLLVSIFCMPFNLAMIRSLNGYHWPFKDEWCKIVPFMQTLAVVANILTLVAMAVERYLVIIYPLKTKILQTTPMTIIIIAYIWIIASCYAIPCALWYEASGKIGNCKLQDGIDTEMEVYRGLTFVLLFILPMSFCSAVYAIIGHKLWKQNTIGIQSSHYEQLRMRTTIRVIAMLVLVQVLFTVTWAPTMCYEFVASLSDDFKISESTLNTRYYLQWLAMCNSCLNPIVYTFMHEKFRKSVMCQDRKLVGKKRNRVAPSSQPINVAVTGNSTSGSMQMHPKRRVVTFETKSTH